MDFEQQAAEIRALGNGKTPVDLYTITKRLNLDIVKKPTTSALMSPDGKPHIILNSRKHPYQQRAEWAHEIGHFVLHVGNQLFMPKEWTDRQEAEAWNFAYYLMISTEELESLMSEGVRRSQFIFDTSRHFEVPISFASERLQLFENKVLYR